MATVALVRQAIFHVLDEASPRTPGLQWDFTDDEQRVDFADQVVAWLAQRSPVSAARPINQCDGCRRKLHLGTNGYHYNFNGSGALPVMACTAERYAAASARPRLRRWTMWVGGDGLNPREDESGAYVLYSDLSAIEPITVTQAMVDAVNAQDGWAGFTLKDVQGIVDAIASAERTTNTPEDPKRG